MEMRKNPLFSIETNELNRFHTSGFERNSSSPLHIQPSTSNNNNPGKVPILSVRLGTHPWPDRNKCMIKKYQKRILNERNDENTNVVEKVPVFEKEATLNVGLSSHGRVRESAGAKYFMKHARTAN